MEVMEVSFAFDMAGSLLSFQPRLKSHYFKSGLHWSSFLSLPNSSLALIRTSLYFLHTIQSTGLFVYMLLVLAQKLHVSKDFLISVTSPGMPWALFLPSFSFSLLSFLFLFIAPRQHIQMHTYTNAQLFFFFYFLFETKHCHQCTKLPWTSCSYFKEMVYTCSL